MDSNKIAFEDGLRTLYEVSSILNADINQQQILAEVLDILYNDLTLTSAAVMLLSLDTQEISVEMAHSISGARTDAIRYQLGEGITGRVIESGESEVVPQISTDPRFLDRLSLLKTFPDKELSFICIPIKTGIQTVGAISVSRLYDPHVDLDGMVRLLSVVASMMAHDLKAKQDAEAARQQLEQENTRLRNELESRYRPENIIGNSKSMRDVFSAIHQVAKSNTTVLIRGESGTGKELVAHAIHFASARAQGAFIRLNCAALNETLLESELFGHEKGAFTGAIQKRKGHIETAENGTLFLDEIGDFSPAIQVKLLRVLQEREYTKVGSDTSVKTNARIIVATNRDLEQAVSKGDFRQDLYYRINVFPIVLPPLRDRKTDILQLANYFSSKYAKLCNKEIRRISTPAINMMVSYHWPGNVRELENCIERAVLLSNEGVIHGHHLPPTLQTSDATDTIGQGSLEDKVRLFERDILVDAIKRHSGNLAAAARDIQTTPRIIRYKVKQLHIDYKKYRRQR